MSLDLVYLAKATCVGAVAGLLSGSFGIGGGMVATPITRLWLGLSPYVAIGTSLVLIAPTAVAGAVSYAKQDMYSKFLARTCVVPAMVGTVFGSFVSPYVNGHVLMLIVALLIFVSGFDFATGIVKKLMGDVASDKKEIKSLRPLGRPTLVACLVGLATGFLSGLVGIGGGFILVPAFVYAFGSSIKEAFGTSLLIVAAVAVPGALVHALHGDVNLPVALAMILGSVPGAKIGASFALRMKDAQLKQAFGVVLLIVSSVFAVREIQSLL